MRPPVRSRFGGLLRLTLAWRHAIRRLPAPVREIVERPSYWFSVMLAFGIVLLFGIGSPMQVDRLRNLVFDGYQRVLPRDWDPETPVRIVDIDEESLTRYGQWPWPRSRLAEMVQRLGEAGAGVIAFDMVFAEPDRSSGENLIPLLPDSPAREALAREVAANPTNDARLASAIAAYPTVLGAIGVQAERPLGLRRKAGIAVAGDDPAPHLPQFRGVVTPLVPLAEASAGIGLLNWLPDADQTIRSVLLLGRTDGVILPSLVVEALRVAQGASTLVVRAANASGQTAFGADSGINGLKIGQIQVPTGRHGDMRVRFSHHQPDRFIPAWKILEDDTALADVAGRVVFVGTSAAGLLEQRATPLDPSVPGVEVHAQLAEHILEGGNLIRPDWAPGIEIAVTVLVCLGFMVFLPLGHPFLLAGIGLAVVTGLVGGSVRLFAVEGVLLDPLIPSLSFAFVYLAGVLNLFWAERTQKRQVRFAFERYLPPAVVDRVASDPRLLALGGETRMLTIMFTDMRSFTTISEGLSAHDLTEFMNEYLTPMTDLVIEHGGMVDKYIGDAIMAFWNAPLDVPDHGRLAAKTALSMIRKLDELNERWQAAPPGNRTNFPIVQAGLGINTGLCCVGNLGSTRRMNYSVIGDDVNVASRLEGATKQLRLDFLAAESSWELAPDLAWLEIDRLILKGKEKPTRVFTILGDEAWAKTNEFITLKVTHDAVLKAYRACRFDSVPPLAAQAAVLAPRRIRGVYELYAERAARYAADPPPPGWDGSTKLEDK